MPCQDLGQDRRSSRWCCKARAHALANFHQEIIPSDVSRFHLRRRASPLLGPRETEGRHDRALLHHILKDKQFKHHRPEVLSVHHTDELNLPGTERTQQSLPAPVQLPQVLVPGVHEERHKGISNGMLLQSALSTYSSAPCRTCKQCCSVEDFVVPLELPAVNPHPVSLPPAAEGGTTAETLTVEEQQKLESVGWRMLNLPLIVCHSANGMPFFFPLQKVDAYNSLWEPPIPALQRATKSHPAAGALAAQPQPFLLKTAKQQQAFHHQTQLTWHCRFKHW